MPEIQMLVSKQISAQEELEKWLREHWQEGLFKASPPHYRFAGAYTLYGSIVRYQGRDYILKRYNPLGIDGIQAEKANYLLFGEHSLFPRLEAFVPKGTQSIASMSYGIVVSYYPDQLPASGNSLVEVLAIGLSLATMFTYFVEKGHIYFDLRSDALRLDSERALHLIDFTDLITTDELLSRSTGCAGLPVVNRESRLVPPEGTNYQRTYEDYLRDKLPWSTVRGAAHAIDPQEYQVFSLAGLIVELLVGASPEPALSSRIASSGHPNDGAFTSDERNRLLDCLTRMQDPIGKNRPLLDEIREMFWSFLSSRLTSESTALNLASIRAARLLRTISRRESDGISSEIHETLERYWSTL